MTEAGWTREKPSKEGVYWFRWTENSNPLILSVAKDDCDWRVLEMGNQYDGALAGYSGGEFLGPITPDSYQRGRVAGLWEAVPLACKYCNDRTKWTPMSNSGYHVCNMPEPGFVRCQAIKIHAALAQQAQGEKGVGDVHK